MKRFLLLVLLSALTGGLSPQSTWAQNFVYYDGNSWLGVALTDQAARAGSSSNINGAAIRDVFPDGPAARAGLRSGDVIVALNGQKVAGVDDLRVALRGARPQQTVAVAILRNGQPQTLQVKLGERPHDFAATQPIPPIPPMPPIHIPEIHIPPIPPMTVGMENLMGMPERQNLSMGMSVETMPEQLATYFGVKQGQHAVLVRSVADASPAQKAGFHAGDVILRIDEKPVRTVGEFWQSLREARGKAVSVGILRHGRPVTVKVASVPSDAGFMMPDRAELQRQIAAAREDAEKARRELDSPQFRKQLEDARRQAQAAARQWQKQAEQLRRQSERWQ